MESLLYQDTDSFPSILEPIYTTFCARPGIVSLLVDYPGYDGPFYILAMKKCDHYTRGCEGECESNDPLCEACKANKCGEVHS